MVLDANGLGQLGTTVGAWGNPRGWVLEGGHLLDQLLSVWWVVSDVRGVGPPL